MVIRCGPLPKPDRRLAQKPCVSTATIKITTPTQLNSVGRQASKPASAICRSLSVSTTAASAAEFVRKRLYAAVVEGQPEAVDCHVGQGVQQPHHEDQCRKGENASPDVAQCSVDQRRAGNYGRQREPDAGQRLCEAQQRRLVMIIGEDILHARQCIEEFKRCDQHKAHAQPAVWRGSRDFCGRGQSQSPRARRLQQKTEGVSYRCLYLRIPAVP